MSRSAKKRGPGETESSAEKKHRHAGGETRETPREVGEKKRSREAQREEGDTRKRASVEALWKVPPARRALDPNQPSHQALVSLIVREGRSRLHAPERQCWVAASELYRALVCKACAQDSFALSLGPRLDELWHRGRSLCRGALCIVLTSRQVILNTELWAQLQTYLGVVVHHSTLSENDPSEAKLERFSLLVRALFLDRP
jgi:hypothetical protein